MAAVMHQRFAPMPSALPSGEGISGDGVVLALDDLVADARGEIVLFNDSGLRVLTLEASIAVVGEGRSGRHVTSTGADVSGWRYLAFGNGIKLFFDPELTLLLSAGQP